jgi:hypothetical protein
MAPILIHLTSSGSKKKEPTCICLAPLSREVFSGYYAQEENLWLKEVMRKNSDKKLFSHFTRDNYVQKSTIFQLRAVQKVP